MPASTITLIITWCQVPPSHQLPLFPIPSPVTSSSPTHPHFTHTHTPTPDHFLIFSLIWPLTSLHISPPNARESVETQLHCPIVPKQLKNWTRAHLSMGLLPSSRFQALPSQRKPPSCVSASRRCPGPISRALAAQVCTGRAASEEQQKGGLLRPPSSSRRADGYGWGHDKPLPHPPLSLLMLTARARNLKNSQLCLAPASCQAGT